MAPKVYFFRLLLRSHKQYINDTQAIHILTRGPTPLVVAAGPGLPGGPSSPYRAQVHNVSTFHNNIE